jgi:hypothetical protein
MLLVVRELLAGPRRFEDLLELGHGRDPGCIATYYFIEKFEKSVGICCEDVESRVY